MRKRGGSAADLGMLLSHTGASMPSLREFSVRKQWASAFAFFYFFLGNLYLQFCHKLAFLVHPSVAGAIRSRKRIGRTPDDNTSNTDAKMDPRTQFGADFNPDGTFEAGACVCTTY